jgi:2-haloacid dehalogenase
MASHVSAARAPAAGPEAIDAVVFDAYGTLFDVYSVAGVAEQLYPGRGGDLARTWRDRQLMYTWLRTLSDRYKPFLAVTRDALRHACAQLSLELDTTREERLMGQYACLSAFPENLGALRELKRLGLPLGILSNGEPDMLAASVRSAGMEGLFEHLLSVDPVRRYKTDAQAYALGPAAFGVAASRILFVSSNGWDAVGATWFGYPAFWINRSAMPPEELDTPVAATGSLLTDVAGFVSQTRSRR